MQYSRLGSTDIKVSRVCLGTMTWGTQNDQQDANSHIEYALVQGVNFIDTAEMYSIPPTAESYGATETIIGHYLASNPNRRKDIILATKIAGSGLSYIRGGGPITGEAVISSVDASLKRLQTDYIDLYQLHWPNRTTPHFGKQWPGRFNFTDTNGAEESAQMLEILQALQSCIQAGKIRYCGLSDDTPWGISEYLRLSEKHSLPRMVSIQNEFNLLHSKDWPYVIEQCVHGQVAYLPWSPLGGGMLSGKYLNGARPAGSRWTLTQRMGLFRDTTQSQAAISQYVSLAKEHGLTPVQLALAWCNQVNGVTSTIIGATSMTQLEEDIQAFDITLSDDVLDGVQKVLRAYPMPF
ncbi:aldo/keto reductase [Aliiglaciecola sp. CAU 1673]|uniref:aldo/keto reductase n=1 Tax=Aliiglaciecola sp. CAU 1673 TaxID=3032595 RepID=UPI0023DAD0A5|nr:aldo/keto reductase [Aliiglaciecola sp. CAU 1673]MDF2178561.1 aldo/keto reductase [Aliiglaciecola sp. CAU 1673]